MGHTKKTMDLRLRQMTGEPLQTLWDSEGRDLPVTRGRSLDIEAIKSLLRRGVRAFAVVGVGPQLRWLDGANSLEFWKSEAHDHLYEESRPYLEDYPGEYFYRASEWTTASGETIILFEMNH